jgi:hypothetical protein
MNDSNKGQLTTATLAVALIAVLVPTGCAGGLRPPTVYTPPATSPPSQVGAPPPAS